MTPCLDELAPDGMSAVVAIVEWHCTSSAKSCQRGTTLTASMLRWMQIGEHFDGIDEGASQYTPNAFRCSIFPED